MNAPVPNTKAELLQKTVEHVDITSYDARPIIDSMRKMSFSSRDTARAADIFNMALADKGCSTWLILAGSTSAGGCCAAREAPQPLGSASDFASAASASIGVSAQRVHISACTRSLMTDAVTS